MSRTDIAELPEVPQSGTVANQVYELALRNEYVDAPQCAAALGISEDEAGTAIGDLVELRLLHLVHGCTYAYVAVNPMTASLQLLAVHDEELRSRQHRLEQLRQRMHSLMPLYRSQLAREPDPGPVQRIEDAEVARGVVAGLLADAGSEVLLARSYEDPLGQAALTGVDARLRADAGLRVRLLLPQSARFDPTLREYVGQLVARAGEARTTTAGVAWLMIVDGSTGVVPLEDGTGVALLRDPAVVAGFRRGFEGLWSPAESFDGHYDPESGRVASAEVDAAIVRMLVNGVEDKVIARTLGISARTCQRRISDLMESLDARTRFQAGYLLRTRGRDGESAAA
ncbi:LuxR family transcriptional regulator [Streptomyces wuyuanensis]|uniref:LuxR family transcriptional regulator n=1 Tax=Streptomyces wuyuanensis TaxID=1196353 RepID=UPI0037B14E99